MMRVITRKIRGYLEIEFQSDRLLPNLTSGLLIGFTEIIFAVSLGSLIFSGGLAPFLPYGVGIAIASLAITTIIITLTTSVPGIVTGLQESPSVIQGLIVAGLFASLTSTKETDGLNSILAVLAFTSLLTGLFFLALGYFKLGGLVRYVPYPVVGGFLAGTGWLLVQASISVMTDFPLNLSSIPLLIHPDQLLRWLPGTILALILVFSLKRIDHFLTMPGILTGAIIIFYATLLVSGTTIEGAVQRGLLLGELSAEASWQPLRISELTATNALLRQIGNISTIFILSVLNLLLNTTGLELAIERDIDINHELKVAGFANMLSGLFGGMVGYQTLSESTLSYRLRGRGRIVGLVSGIIPVITLFTGASVVVFFPKLILGGLLLFLGLDFLIEWLITGWSKLSRIDYGVVVLILIVIASTDFLTGVGVGLLSTVLLFVANYSRINVVHHALSGVEIHSNVERYNHQWQKLKELGDHTHILELQGYIFFGTASALLECIRARVKEKNRLPVRFLILDFRRVSGLDSSAIFSFKKCRQLAESQNFNIVMTHISPRIREKIRRGGLFDDSRKVSLFPDLDHGLEWCEQCLLDMAAIPNVQKPESLWERLVAQGFPEEKICQLMKYLEPIQVETGGYLVRQGDEAKDLFLIESGKVSIYLEMGDQKRIRLQTLSERVVVGELGLYIDFKRTAAIIAEESCSAYRLSKSALVEIKQQDPDLAAAIHEFIACILARRLADTTRLLAVLDQ